MLTERENDIIKTLQDKSETAKIIICKVKLIKKIIKARQSLLNKGYDIGGLTHDLYNKMGYDFNEFSFTELQDLLQKIKTIPKEVSN